jgi:hypothetical protein
MAYAGSSCAPSSYSGRAQEDQKLELGYRLVRAAGVGEILGEDEPRARIVRPQAQPSFQ